jgi:acetyl esterase/lipase
MLTVHRNAWVVPAFQLYGYHVVSVAYRFLPHVSLPEEVGDCKDALVWCFEHLPSILGADTIDTARYVVAGDSAGGTLSTICGHVFEPKPKAVIDVFGVVDITDKYFHTPLPEDQPNPWGEYSQPRDEQELEKLLGDRDPSKAEVICPWDWELEPNMSVEDLRLFWGTPDFTPSEKDFLRMDMVKHSGKRSNKFSILFRREKLSDEEFLAKCKEWSSYYMLDERKREYPPTFFLHGTGDTAVPVEQSSMMAKKLRELGVPVGEAYCEGGQHCFENKIEVSASSRKVSGRGCLT